MESFTFNKNLLKAGISPLMNEDNNQVGTIRSDRGVTIRIYDNDDHVQYLAQAQTPKKFIGTSGPVEIMQIGDSANRILGTVINKSAFLKYSFHYSREDGSIIEINRKA
ncbi:MAG: hypothetical protein M0Z41_14200 [Peptococcaceae bacterium]|jgi:hypothetical protein|nr:hypothetical protein [Peptococcaceae bacterium]